MAFSAEALLAHPFPAIRHAYSERDAILYALGAGSEPTRSTTPTSASSTKTRLQVLPSMAVTLGLARPVGAGADPRHRLGLAASCRSERPVPVAAAAGRHGGRGGRARLGRGPRRGARRRGAMIERSDHDADDALDGVMEQTPAARRRRLRSPLLRAAPAAVRRRRNARPTSVSASGHRSARP